MSEEMILEFPGTFTADSGKRHLMQFSFRHTPLEQLELVGTYDQDPRALSLTVGTVGEAGGRLPDGFTLTARRATLSDIFSRPAGGARCVFAAECVSIASSHGLLINNPFPANVKCRYRWVLTGSTWLDQWLECNTQDEERQVFLPNGMGTVEVGLDMQATSLSASTYGHIGRKVFNVPVLTVTGDASGRTLGEVIAGVPQDGILYLCGCLSCLSRARVDWIEQIISVLHPQDDKSSEFLVGRKIRRVRSAFPKLASDAGMLPPSVPARMLSAAAAKMMAHGDNVVQAVQFYVSSFVLEEEQEFVALTTALEALKQAYLVKRPIQGTLDKCAFEALQAALEKNIREHEAVRKASTDDAQAIVTKLPELNRPAYAAIVEEMCTKIGVDLRKLYPAGLTFIGMRNDMIHQGRVPESQELRTETVKLRLLVEAILKKMLL